MADHDIVVVGASAGGLEALARLVRSLPDDLPAAVFVVLHVPPPPPARCPTSSPGRGRLPASDAKDLEPIESGHVYVAPPDRHLLLQADHVHLSRSAEGGAGDRAGTVGCVERRRGGGCGPPGLVRGGDRRGATRCRRRGPEVTAAP